MSTCRSTICRGTTPTGPESQVKSILTPLPSLATLTSDIRPLSRSGRLAPGGTYQLRQRKKSTPIFLPPRIPSPEGGHRQKYWSLCLHPDPHLPAVLLVHASGERQEGRGGPVVLEPPPVLEPKGVCEVEQGHHGHDARRQEPVDLGVVVVDSRLIAGRFI